MSDISRKNIARLSDELGLITRIVDDIKKSERILSPWKRKLVTWNELYKLVQNNRHYEGLARIFVPEILRAVETVVGNLYKILLGQDPSFEYQGQSELDEPAAQALTQLVGYQMDENNFKIRLMDSLRQMAILGLTVRKVLWDFTQVNQRSKKATYKKEVDPITKEVKNTKTVSTENEMVTVKDHWTFEPVDLLSFHISDIMTPYNDIQKATWIAEQYLVEKHWVKDKIKKGWFVDTNYDEMEPSTAWNASDAARYAIMRRQASGYTTSGQVSGYAQPEPKKAIEIIERWGLLEAKYVYDPKELKEMGLDKDDLVETVLVIANQKFILKLEANPFWHNRKPYVSSPYVAQDNEFPGIGVAQIGESLQEELNDTRNQTMDNKSLILMNMWLKGRGSGIKNQDLRIRPMGVINTNDMNGLKPLAPPVLTGVGVNIEGVIKEDLRQSVGASSNMQGIAQAGIDTATQANATNLASQGRLLLTAQQYAELVLKPMLIMAESLNYQFFDTSKVIKIIGENGIKFVNMNPDDIVGNKEVVVRLNTDLDDNPGIRRNQLLQFLTIVQQMPPQGIAYHWKLLDRVYKSFFPTGHSLEDLYQAPPQFENLLKPDEEFELMRNEVPVTVKQGDDDQEHIKAHQADYNATKYRLSPVTHKLLGDHIIAHVKQATQKVQAQKQQQIMAAMAAQGGGKSGGGLNTGQIPGASAFTNSQPTTPGQMMGQVPGQ